MKLSRIIWILPFLIFSLGFNLSHLVTGPSTVNQSQPTNLEALLASGGRIPLSRASQGDLELIPGISDSISLELIKRRSVIVEEAKKLSSTSKHRALEIAKGIGEQKSRDFSRYLSVTD